MLNTDRHIYQILTKRTHYMAHIIRKLELPLPPHIWLGTSVESQKFADTPHTGIAQHPGRRCPLAIVRATAGAARPPAIPRQPGLDRGRRRVRRRPTPWRSGLVSPDAR